MATSQTFVHCLIFMASYVLVIEATSSPKHVTVVAGYRHPTPPKFIYLFHNDEVLIMGSSGAPPQFLNKEIALLTVSSTLPSKFSAATARELVNTSTEVFLFGGNDIQFLSSYNKGNTIILPYEPDFEFVKDGGPDAVAKRGDDLIFFKGCKMAVKHMSGEWEEPEDVRSLGLPCHADAAWNDENIPFILRGDQIWKWKEDGTVDGPHEFHDIYTVKSWILKPYEVSCADGWYLYDDLNTCYRLFHEKKTWSDARTACQTLGGDLVTIKDEGTSEFVNDLVQKDYAYYWIGLNDLVEEGKFVWLDESDEVTFKNWLPGEPNDFQGNEDCAHFTSNQFWNDRPCEHKLSYICQLTVTRE